MPSLLQFKAEVSSFLKILLNFFRGFLKSHYINLKKTLCFQILRAAHCAILKTECSTLWGNDAKFHIFLHKKIFILKNGFFWVN